MYTKTLVSVVVLAISFFFASQATMGLWIAIVACWILMASRLAQAEAHHKEQVELLRKLRDIERLQLPLGTDLRDL